MTALGAVTAAAGETSSPAGAGSAEAVLAERLEAAFLAEAGLRCRRARTRHRLR
ncbi:MAG: hypothetical protein ACRDN0_27325 [Trebonia sp.]